MTHRFPGLGMEPRLGKGVYVAPNATLVGDVALGDEASVWFGAVLRGDVNWIRIGSGTNVQDGSKLHVTYETHPLEIGRRVALAHGCIVHGCRIEDGCLIGIGAVVLDGVRIGEGSIVGAGALVPENTEVPAGRLVMGVPAKVVRPVRPEEAMRVRRIVSRYIDLKNDYLKRER